MERSRLDFTIETLGDCRFASPMTHVRFVGEDARVLYPSTMNDLDGWVAAFVHPSGTAVRVRGDRGRGLGGTAAREGNSAHRDYT